MISDGKLENQIAKFNYLNITNRLLTIFFLQIFQLGIDVAVAGMIVANVMVLIYIVRIMMAHLNAIQQNVRAGATQCLALPNRFSARQNVHKMK